MPPPLPKIGSAPLAKEPPSLPKTSKEREAKIDSTNAKRRVFSLAKKIAQKLDGEIDRGHAIGPFVAMLLIAISKDSFDPIWDYIILLIQASIIIGQIAGVILEAIKLAINGGLAIILLYYLQRNGWLVKQKVKYIARGLVFLDFIPGIDFLPLETTSVFYTWHHVKKRAQKAKEAKEKLKYASEGELQAIDGDIENFDDPNLEIKGRGRGVGMPPVIGTLPSQLPKGPPPLPGSRKEAGVLDYSEEFAPKQGMFDRNSDFNKRPDWINDDVDKRVAKDYEGKALKNRLDGNNEMANRYDAEAKHFQDRQEKKDRARLDFPSKNVVDLRHNPLHDRTEGRDGDRKEVA